MPWLRTGDTAATYPAMLAVAGARGADDRLINEAFGFVMRCAILSAAHLTDYVIDAGTAQLVGGPRTQQLVRLCVQVGIFTPTDGPVKAWRLKADPEFLHIRLREEVMRERRQRNDPRDPALVVPVRLRDGDNCRWCGVFVQWMGKRTNRSATYDHLDPDDLGKVETKPARLVVACLGCNSGRCDAREDWERTHTLRPAPTDPRYGATTAAYLTKHGHPTQQNATNDEPAATTKGTAPDRERPADPARPQAVRPADPAPTGARPEVTPTAPDVTTRPTTAPTPDPARPPAVRPDPTALADPALRSPSELTSEVVPELLPQVPGTGSAGSGRVGTPTHPSTQVTGKHDPDPPHDRSPAPRRRRGRRGRSSQPGGEP